MLISVKPLRVHTTTTKGAKSTLYKRKRWAYNLKHLKLTETKKLTYKSPAYYNILWVGEMRVSDVLRYILDMLKSEGKEKVGLDRLELEMLPDSISEELLVMMGYDGVRRRKVEKPPLLLLPPRV
jgi:hypothetical protein